MSTLKLGCIPKHHPLRVGGLNKCKLLKGKVITTDLKLNTVFKSDNFFFRLGVLNYYALNILSNNSRFLTIHSKFNRVIYSWVSPCLL